MLKCWSAFAVGTTLLTAQAVVSLEGSCRQCKHKAELTYDDEGLQGSPEKGQADGGGPDWDLESHWDPEQDSVFI